MPRNKQLNDYEKGQIDALSAQNLSAGKISGIIMRSKKVVCSYLNDKENYGKSKRSGRKPSLSSRDKRMIIRTASNQNITRNQIKSKLGLEVSKWTIGRVLHSDPNIKRMKLKVMPSLTAAHKLNRLKWAEDHMTWSDNWKNVVFSDEKKFNLDGPDGYQYYWHDLRKEKKYYSKRCFGGGSVMVWAAFGYNGKTNIAFTSSRMKSQDYIQVLSAHLLPFVPNIAGTNWIFQADNAKIHTSNDTKTWLECNNVRYMQWPSVSPDMNPIENLWGELVRRVYANGKQYDTVEDLKTAIIENWEDIDRSVLRNLTDSMPKRVFNLILKKGHTIN